MKKFIGITGISCSGKTQLSDTLADTLGRDECLLISMDDYYKELTPEQHKVLYDDEAEINFDVPDAIDFDKLHSHLDAIKHNRPISLPKFDTGSCVLDEANSKKIQDPGKYKYVIVEGVFIMSCEKLQRLFDVKIWVDTSEYVCALRRFIKYQKDIKGYTPDFVYNQCVKFVVPGQEKYVKPFKSDCDIFYNGEKINQNYVDMIVFYVKQFQCKRGVNGVTTTKSISNGI